MLLLVSGVCHRFSDHFFYHQLFLGELGEFWSLGDFARSIMLINSTVVFVAAVRLLPLYLQVSDKLTKAISQLAVAATSQRIEIKADRRTYLVDSEDILNVAGLGNYVTYYLKYGDKLVAYGTVKAALAALPKSFIRLHKSYIVNRPKIDSYHSENICIGSHRIPRGKSVSYGVLLQKY